jgi:hypothetical protein
MPSTQTIDEKTRWRLGVLEHVEAQSVGSMTLARERVARALGLSAGSLERVRRGRVKGVKGFVAEAIRGAFVAVIQREIAGLEHELELARQGGLDLAETRAVEACAALAEARGLICEMRGDRTWLEIVKAFRRA